MSTVNYINVSLESIHSFAVVRAVFRYMFLDEKEERKKQARSNKQTKQSNTAHPRQSLFLEKMSCVHVLIQPPSGFREYRKATKERKGDRQGLKPGV